MKTQLKSHLAGMDEEEIIQLVLDLYSVHNEVKVYLDCYMAPKEQTNLEECKQIIQQEFVLNPNGFPITRFSVCRKAVSDFKKLKPSADSIAELMVFYIETACRFAYGYRELWVQFCMQSSEILS